MHQRGDLQDNPWGICRTWVMNVKQGPDKQLMVRLAGLILVGLVMAVIFSSGYEDRARKRGEPTGQDDGFRIVELPAAPDEGIANVYDARSSIAAAIAPSQAGTGESRPLWAGGASGSDVPEPLPQGAKAAETCSCGDLHRLWLEEPRMVGEHVQDLQEGLTVSGHYAGPADGVFGPGTDRAVRAFQTSAGLPDNGIVDMAVWMALGRICEPIVATSLKPSGDIIEASPDPGYGPGQAVWRAVLIDTSNLTVTLLENGKPVNQYRVGVGKPSTPTPLGYFKVTDKAAWAGGFGTRWMGLDVPWGKYGIHGTNKPWTVGQRKSGGCVRMLNRDVERLYSIVEVGTPVIITAGHFGALGSTRPRIEPGAKGSYVYAIQLRLAKLGYKHAGVDGVYGPATERAIMQLQRDKGLPVTGIVDMQTYQALGMSVMD
jgi:peptidoglycan hydrolase-like protein with peptidoglycan-binding domain